MGVEYKKGKTVERVYAGEIICCGGAINSPQLLQLSGVGRADDLTALNINVVQDLPGVGRNLQDHLELYVQYACKKPVSMYPALKWYRQPWIGLKWLFGRTGEAATNHFEAGGFIRGNARVGLSQHPVSLFAHCHPLRRIVTAPRGTAIRCISAP